MKGEEERKKKYQENNHLHSFLKFKLFQSAILSFLLPRIWVTLLSNRNYFRECKTKQFWICWSKRNKSAEEF
jgi:hypothetical protein